MFGDGTRRFAGIAGTALGVLALAVPVTAGAATITVDTSEGTQADNGNCSLREAILAANADVAEDDCHRGNGRDKIAFDIAGSELIGLANNLPPVTAPATIDGTSEPDYAGAPVVRIDSAGAIRGLKTTADEVVIRGLVVTNFSKGVQLGGDHGRLAGNLIGVDEAGDDAGNSRGIRVTGKDNRIGGGRDGDANVISASTGDGIFAVGPGTRIQGNYIGTDPSGTSARPNGLNGIEVGAAGARILDNLISGNGDKGIHFGGADGATVRGNLVGLRADGQSALPNGGDGILVGGEKVTIGGPKPKHRNVISGNGGDGIEIGAFGTGDRARVLGNYIGTEAGGDDDLGNGGMGVRVVDGSGNLIGGNEPKEANVISDNLVGVFIGGGGSTARHNVVSGNLIGTDAAGVQNFGNQSGAVRLTTKARDNTVGGTHKGEGNLMRFTPGGAISVGGGTTAFGNSFLGNLAFDNGEEVIDLAEDGVTPNDIGPPSDTDSGPNKLQNFPFLFGGDEQTDHIIGDLDSTARTKFRIEFFVSDAPDDAQRFVGAKTVKTAGDGHVEFNFKSDTNLPVGDFLTATATRLDGKDLTDTSELSDDADVSVGP